MERRYVMYVTIVILCIISIGIGVYSQVFYENSTDDKLMIGTNKAESKKTEEEVGIKDKFNDIFTNSLIYVTNSISNKAVRKDMSKDLVYTVNQVSKIEAREI